MTRSCKHCGASLEGLPLTRGYCSRSCGAHASKNRQHGLTNTVEHRIWRRIRRRCFSPQYHNYNRYGGRGITVCERWGLFENFLSDMGPRPSAEYTVERINNDGNYEPSNCKWATRLEQSRNRSNVYTAEQVRAVEDGLLRGLTHRQIGDLIGKSMGSVSTRAYRMRRDSPPLTSHERQEG